MMRWWRRSLTGRLLAPVLPALFLAQAIGLALCWQQFVQDVHERDVSDLQSRTTALAHLIKSLPTVLRADVARVNNNDNTRFWISSAEPAGVDDWLDQAYVHLRTPLETILGLTGSAVADSGLVSVPLRADVSRAALSEAASWGVPQPVGGEFLPGVRVLDYRDRRGAGMIVPLGEGQVLNAAYYRSAVPSIWATQLPYTLMLMVLLVSAVTFLTARRLALPFREMTQAAEAVGRGEATPPLSECGPEDIRRTAEAFNRMQTRLHRYVEDRTRMLGAIGHDLRTPLTTLRLRAELVPDLELQQKMLATIEEMQSMTEAALDFAREECVVQDTRTVDLSSMVESLCDDMADLGHRVSFVAADTLPYRCRPDALRRSVRNLLENALRYAGHAQVRIENEDKGIAIVVEDSGPGIPEERFEDVFAPFFRLEESRNRDTGGIGLGLSIARAIARQHGGDIVLKSGAPGLRASVILPT